MSETTQFSVASAVELRDVDFSYEGQGKSMLLSNVTVSFPKGQTVVIMGRSGCGKSTLLNLIAGLERPTRGAIEHYCRDGEARYVDFTNIPDNKVVDFRRRNIGFVFQRFNLLPDLTVFQNVLIAARIAGLTPSISTDATFDALESVGLCALQERLPNSLSAGEAQRVGIARAIVKRPQLVLADEPTGSLDSRTASMIVSSLMSAAQHIQGTLVIVTHDEAVASNFNTVYKLDGGSLSLCNERQAL